MNKTDRVRELASRPNGVRAAEYPALTNLVYRMAARGQLFLGKLGRRTVHYFLTKEEAERFVSKNLPAHAYKVAKKAARPGARDGWGPNDPPVFTDKTVYTYAPKPPAQVFRTNTFSL